MALRTISPSRDDVVELTEIEDQKENIQPLASGRSAKALHALITSDRKVLQDDLRRERERFRSEIEQADKEGVDDPLDIYHRCARLVRLLRRELTESAASSDGRCRRIQRATRTTPS